MSRLTELQVAHLRGVTQPFVLPFEKGKKLTLVYGENGTGKSTLCDALDLIANGRVGSIENRGLGQTAPFWPAIGKQPADVRVTLKSASGDCSASIKSGKVIAVPADGRPRVEVLRRAQILDLLETTPGKRYEAIKKFIDVAGMEKSEAALREAIKAVQQRRDDAAVRISENQIAINGFWAKAGSPAGDPVAWARQQQAAGTMVLASSPMETVELAYHHFALAVEKFAGVRSSANKTRALLQDALATERLAETAAAADAAVVVAVLRAGESYLGVHPATTACPLCERPEGMSGLRARVKARLAALDILVAAQNATARARKAVNDSELLERGADEDTRQRHVELVNALTLSASIGAVALAAPPDDPDRWTAWVATARPMVDGWSEERTRHSEAAGEAKALARAVKVLDENAGIESSLAQVEGPLRRALEIVEERRKQFTGAILGEIATAVGELYEKVHPGEGLDAVVLQLDPAKRASLEIGVPFNGVPAAPPGAYLSDSHLDTLGLCVFMALAARGGAAETILVLDDVLGSVDEPHVDRLIEMLYEESKNFRHCLITTHYGPWRHKFRWGWLRNGEVQFVELTRWSHSGGVTTVRSLGEVDRLRMLLAEPVLDTQSVVAKAGVVLEAALDFLTLLYECPVPRKGSNEYTLGDLLPAIEKKKLRPALRVEVGRKDAGTGEMHYVEHRLETIINELEQIAQARNVMGCHFNTIGASLPDADAEGFSRKVLN